MSELRTDPVTGRVVIIAENRSQRPGALDVSADLPTDGECPFCEDNESLTPGEVAQVNAYVVRRLAEAGVTIKSVYVCPHRRSDGCAQWPLVGPAHLFVYIQQRENSAGAR